MFGAAILQDHLASLHVPPDAATECEVQQLVWAFVDERKAAGWSPERVIVSLKRIAHDAGVPISTVGEPYDPTRATADAFIAKLVGWSILRFYRIQ